MVDSADLTGVGGSQSPLGIDTNRIQRRVNGLCANGQAIQSIHSDGTVTCNSGPGVRAAYDDAGVDLPGTCKTVVTLTLPTGQWLILGKATANGYGAWGAVCQLQTDFDYDQSETSLQWDDQSHNAVQNLSLMVVRDAPAFFTAPTRCSEFWGDAHLTWAKLSAIRVGALSNAPS